MFVNLNEKLKFKKLKIDLIDLIIIVNVLFLVWMMGFFFFSVWVGFGYCVFFLVCLYEIFIINVLREFELIKFNFFRN